MEKEELRFYAFGNYYLSSLQQGLQAGHNVGEILVSFEAGSVQDNMARDWAINYKTMVLLNGGNSASLTDLYAFFDRLASEGMDYPYVQFFEDEVSLNGALTDVAIVLPESIFENARLLRMDEIASEDLKLAGFESWEIELMEEINKYGLAH